MPQIELSAGTIEYADSGGEGPTLVLLHGVTMDGALWDDVVAELGPDFRCIRPTLPLGSHRIPMRPDADLSLRGLALLVGEFLDRLDLREVTLVLNDWGGAQLLISEERTERIARLVLCACEAFDNYPPGLPGKGIQLAARLPGGLAVLLRLLRVRAVRRLPGSWAWMTKRPLPHELLDSWFRPADTHPEIRRDLRRYGRSVPSRRTLLDLAERMRSFDKPVLVAWALEDKLMPAAHGPALAGLFPDARLVEIEDSRTLVPKDQPELLARTIGEFAGRRRVSPPG